MAARPRRWRSDCTDSLRGENFSGKTTLSFPFSAETMPYTYNHSKKSGGLPRQSAFGARYPFGFGLSYTSFTYPAAKLKTDTVDLDGEVEVLVTVKNTGTIDGEEVVQLYIHDRHASLVRPVKELKGFARVPLKAGEEKTGDLYLQNRSPLLLQERKADS